MFPYGLRPKAVTSVNKTKEAYERDILRFSGTDIAYAVIYNKDRNSKAYQEEEYIHYPSHGGKPVSVRIIEGRNLNACKTDDRIEH